MSVQRVKVVRLYLYICIYVGHGSHVLVPADLQQRRESPVPLLQARFQPGNPINMSAILDFSQVNR